jgi:hypothetical protein
MLVRPPDADAQGARAHPRRPPRRGHRRPSQSVPIGLFAQQDERGLVVQRWSILIVQRRSLLLQGRRMGGREKTAEQHEGIRRRRGVGEVGQKGCGYHGRTR